tara:strand:- start:10283 stop:11755 length:1473 start_codon:yes stop_codon:yes gene_type:complete
LNKGFRNTASTILFFVSSLIIYGSIVELSTKDLNPIDQSKKQVLALIKKLALPSRKFTEAFLQLKNLKTSNIVHPTLPLIISRSARGSIYNQLKAGFSFEYEPGTKPNMGFLVLAAPDPYNGDPLISIWDLNKQEEVYNYPISKQSLIKEFNLGRRAQQTLRLKHPIILSDGSLITYLHNSGGTNRSTRVPLIKFDSCGNLLKVNDDYHYHHSLEIDKRGYIYAQIKGDNKKKFKSKKYNKAMEGFVILDKDLNIINTFWLQNIMEENKILSDALIRTESKYDPFHLNDVHPLIDESTGETSVFMSLRQFGLLGFNVTRNKLIWSIVGATQAQHDITPITKKGDVISIFNNGTPNNNLINNYFENSIVLISNLPVDQIDNNPSYFFGRNLKAFGLGFEEYKLDFLPKDKRPKTPTQGRGKISQDRRNLFIEETDEGRLIEVDLNTKKILWSYINKTEKNNDRLMLSWSRKIKKLPFKIDQFNIKNCKKKV